MTTLTSRPAPVDPELPREHYLALVTPTVNILQWVTTKLILTDDSQGAIDLAYETIEDVLRCMVLEDYAIMAMPGTLRHLVYDVAVRPVAGSPFFALRVSFQIMP
jgi:hypothetical protein